MVVDQNMSSLGYVSKYQTVLLSILVQPADIGWLTGNGKKLSCSLAQLGQATCLAVA